MSVAAPPHHPATPRGTAAGSKPWAAYLDRQEAVLALAALVVVSGVSLVNPGFFSGDNFVDIVQKCAYIAIAAIASAAAYTAANWIRANPTKNAEIRATKRHPKMTFKGLVSLL